MKTWRDIKSKAHIGAIVNYAETMFGIEFKSVKKDRYAALCPFHADTKNCLKVYVNKEDEVRIHCFGACKGDWDIFDMIMLGKKCGFLQAQQTWSEHLGIEDFRPDQDHSSRIPEPGETSEPVDTVDFIAPVNPDGKIVAAMEDAAALYHELLISGASHYGEIWNYLARRSVGEEIVRKFNIGYAPSYEDPQYQGRALIDGFLPRFKKDDKIFNAFSEGGLVRLLNDAAVKGYGYYCRQIDCGRPDPISRNYGDTFAGRIVFPINGEDAHPEGFIGRRPDDMGVRRLKLKTREVPLTTKGWLYGIDKANPYIKQYRTIIIVEGIFDYFAFYDLLQDQGKPVVVSTLGSYPQKEAESIFKDLAIEHFIVAFNWDVAGKDGIERIVSHIGGWIYYLGGPAEGQKPYDLLKPAVTAIRGFSLEPHKPMRNAQAEERG